MMFWLINWPNVLINSIKLEYKLKLVSLPLKIVFALGLFIAACAHFIVVFWGGLSVIVCWMTEWAWGMVLSSVYSWNLLGLGRLYIIFNYLDDFLNMEWILLKYFFVCFLESSEFWHFIQLYVSYSMFLTVHNRGILYILWFLLLAVQL